MLSWDEFCSSVSIETEVLHVWTAEGWLVPRDTEAGPAFTELDLARARLILDLKRDLGVNDEGIAIILSLVDQVHGLRLTLRDALRLLGQQDPIGRPDDPVDLAAMDPADSDPTG